MTWRRMGQVQHQFGTIEIPAAVAIAAAVAAAASAGLGTYAAVQQSSTQEKLAKASAQQAEIEAQSKVDAAAYEERQFRRKASLLMGQQEAITAASGVDTTTGSPLLQALDTARQAEIEALNIRRQGDVGAATSRFESSIQRFRAGSFAGQIPGQIAGGVFQAAGSALSQWMSPYRGPRGGGSGGYGYF